MQIRRTFFGLGVFFFGLGITFAGAEGSTASDPTVTFFGSIFCFLVAAILLGWSFRS